MSAKTSNQPGRRTPLSLSGGIAKGGQSHNSKNSNAGNTANGHNNNSKQDNKNQQHNKTEQQQTSSNSQKQQQQHAVDTKENPTKLQTKQMAASAETKIPKPQYQQNSDNAKSQKQTNQNDKKQQLAGEKQQQQNGVTSNHKSSGGNQQQSNKEKQQNDNNIKSNEKDNKKSEAPQEKSEKDDQEITKSQEKPEKDEKKHKNDKKKQELKKDVENKKDDKKDDKKEETKVDKKDDKKNDKKEDKKEDIVIEIDEKINENSENKNAPETDMTAEGHAKDVEKPVEEEMEVAEVAASQQPESQLQDIPMSAPSTPKSLKESKSATPNKPTPTKAEKTPQKLTTKREVTTCIDDFEMEPLHLDSSPPKADAKDKQVAELAPCATSTPGKYLLQKPIAKTEVQLAMKPSVTPERPYAFSQISGRRAIRPTSEYTPSKFKSNPQFRESYRRINTELDATNTSLNVTVGSEIPNNASFSFFGRGRKRERTPPPHSKSAIGEVQATEMEISPPKRARLDFFSVVASPLSLLRNRFSKATLQSSTPVKLQKKLEEKEEDDIEVQNVSGVSVPEDIEKSAEQESECGDDSFEEEDTTEKMPMEGELEILDNGDKELSKQVSEEGDIKITETALQPMTGDPNAKNKRCIVM